MDSVRFANSPVEALIPINGTDGRTGRPYQHFAFQAKPLGAEPGLSASTWHAVGDALYALGQLQQACLQVPRTTLALLRRPAFRREAQSTSALEGTFAPLEEVLAADVLDESEPRSAALQEVLNYVTVANEAFGWVGETGRMLVTMIAERLDVNAEDT